MPGVACRPHSGWWPAEATPSGIPGAPSPCICSGCVYADFSGCLMHLKLSVPTACCLPMSINHSGNDNLPTLEKRKYSNTAAMQALSSSSCVSLGLFMVPSAIFSNYSKMDGNEAYPQVCKHCSLIQLVQLGCTWNWMVLLAVQRANMWMQSWWMRAAFLIRGTSSLCHGSTPEITMQCVLEDQGRFAWSGA